MEKEITISRNTKIILTDKDNGRGSIRIFDKKYWEYYYYWGAMNDNIFDFIKRTSYDYFVNKILNINRCDEFDVIKTFKQLRNDIYNDIGFKYYEHKDFHKNLIKVLKDYQNKCKNRNERYFIDNFDDIYYNLDFDLITDSFERDWIRKEFNAMRSEPWHFIDTKPSKEYKYLTNLHKKIKEKI